MDNICVVIIISIGNLNLKKPIGIMLSSQNIIIKLYIDLVCVLCFELFFILLNSVNNTSGACTITTNNGVLNIKEQSASPLAIITTYGNIFLYSIFFQNVLYAKKNMAIVLRYISGTINNGIKNLFGIISSLNKLISIRYDKNLVVYANPKNKNAFLKYKIPLCFDRSYISFVL